MGLDRTYFSDYVISDNLEDQRDYDFPEAKQRSTFPYPTGKDYYNVGGIEVIDYIKTKLTPEQYKGYLLGNIYKYSGRCQYKGEYEKDLVKMSQYMNWLLKEPNGTNIN